MVSILARRARSQAQSQLSAQLALYGKDRRRIHAQPCERNSLLDWEQIALSYSGSSQVYVGDSFYLNGNCYALYFLPGGTEADGPGIRMHHLTSVYTIMGVNSIYAVVQPSVEQMRAQTSDQSNSSHAVNVDAMRLGKLCL